MKKVYVLKTSMMNGTVTMNSDYSIFLSKELAEETKEAVEKANEKCFFPVENVITEAVIYEDRSEVPILNKESNGNK